MSFIQESRQAIGNALETAGSADSEIVAFAAPESGAESDDAFGKEFREAVDRGDFGWLKANLEGWKERKDLLEDVIARGADVTVWFIQNVGSAKRRVLAALFDKGEEGMIDDVLGRIDTMTGICMI